MTKIQTRTNKTKTHRQRTAPATPGRVILWFTEAFIVADMLANLGAASKAVPPGPTTDRAGGGVRKHGPGAGRIQGLRHSMYGP